MTKNNSIKAVSTDKFWEVLLAESEPEIKISTIEIHRINKQLVLFRDNHPIKTIEPKTATLQDAVDEAVLIEQRRVLLGLIENNIATIN